MIGAPSRSLYSAAYNKDTVERYDDREFEDWTEVFVSPANPTGALFQLIESHDGHTPGHEPRNNLVS